MIPPAPLDYTDEGLSVLPKSLLSLTIFGRSHFSSAFFEFLPKNLTTLDMYSNIDRQNNTPLLQANLKQLPEGLRVLSLSNWVVGGPGILIDQLPRTLTSFSTILNTPFIGEQGDWPPDLTALEFTVKNANYGMFDLLPKQLTSLPLRIDDDRTLMSTFREKLPDSLKSLKINKMDIPLNKNDISLNEKLIPFERRLL